MRWTQAVALDERHGLRTAKACRPGAPVAGAESRGDEPRDDGDNKARSLRGEHEISR